MSDIREVTKLVLEIWDKYDTNRSGALSKSETRRFVEDFYRLVVIGFP